MLTNPATPEIYNAYLRDVDLTAIRMVEASFRATVKRPIIKRTVVNITFDADFTNTKYGFDADAKVSFNFHDRESNESIGSIHSQYSLHYSSKEPMSDEIWLVFRDLNLRLNVWPYAREFAQMATLRMDWPKFTLPVASSPSLRKPKETSG